MDRTNRERGARGNLGTISVLEKSNFTDQSTSVDVCCANTNATCSHAVVKHVQSLPVFRSLLEITPAGKAAVSERMVATVILPDRPVFWREEVGRGM